MPVSPRTLLERKHAAIRAIDKSTQFHRAEAQRLYPKHGTIGVGGADFDHLLKAVVGESYLRALRSGSSTQEAHISAVNDGNECVQKWNDKTHKTRVSINGAYELKRWDKAGEAEADDLHRHFLALLRV